MKNLLVVFFFTVIANIGLSQDYKDLRILFADGNYEKCVRESEKYTQKDDTKKDAEPYIWMAQSLYKISVSGNDDPEYKNAYKDALKFMDKFLKNDKDGSVLAGNDEFQEFHMLMQTSLYESIENEISVENYRKAFSWVLKYPKVSKNTIGSSLVEGATKFRNDDKTAAFKLWRDSENALDTLASTDGWSESDLNMLKLGVLETSKCYVAIRKVENAKALFNKVAQWLEDDADFKAAYDEIVN